MTPSPSAPAAQDETGVASVSLVWTLNGAARPTCRCIDDGAHGDDAAGDGVWGVQHRTAASGQPGDLPRPRHRHRRQHLSSTRIRAASRCWRRSSRPPTCSSCRTTAATTPPGSGPTTPTPWTPWATPTTPGTPQLRGEPPAAYPQPVHRRRGHLGRALLGLRSAMAGMPATTTCKAYLDGGRQAVHHRPERRSVSASGRTTSSAAICMRPTSRMTPGCMR